MVLKPVPDYSSDLSVFRLRASVLNPLLKILMLEYSETFSNYFQKCFTFLSFACIYGHLLNSIIPFQDPLQLILIAGKRTHHSMHLFVFWKTTRIYKALRKQRIRAGFRRLG